MTRLRLGNTEGFTLIELLVVIAIIGILAAIAIPTFASYRRRAFTTNVESDLRNAATAEESYFIETLGAYKSCNNCTGGSTGDLAGFNPSANVDIWAVAGTSTFYLTAQHDVCGTDDTWTFSNGNGMVAGGPCD